jgi:hypothetical protein
MGISLRKRLTHHRVSPLQHKLNELAGLEAAYQAGYAEALRNIQYHILDSAVKKGVRDLIGY